MLTEVLAMVNIVLAFYIMAATFRIKDKQISTPYKIYGLSLILVIVLKFSIIFLRMPLMPREIAFKIYLLFWLKPILVFYSFRPINGTVMNLHPVFESLFLFIAVGFSRRIDLISLNGFSQKIVDRKFLKRFPCTYARKVYSVGRFRTPVCHFLYCKQNREAIKWAYTISYQLTAILIPFLHLRVNMCLSKRNIFSNSDAYLACKFMG